MSTATATTTFLPPVPCDDPLCEVCIDQGGPDDATPPGRAGRVAVVWGAGRWTAGRLAMDADGEVTEADIETDDTLTEGQYLGHVGGRLKGQDRYAEEIEQLQGAWEERQRERQGMRDEEEAHYSGRGVR